MTLLTDHPEAGWLYLLENDHMRAVKVGKTDRNPYERAEELSKATGVPGRFEVAHSWRVVNSARAEKLAHNALRAHRITGGEFFEISAVEAIQVINRTLGVIEEPAVEEPAVEGAASGILEGGRARHLAIFVIIFTLLIIVLPIGAFVTVELVFPGAGNIPLSLGFLAGVVAAFKIAKALARKMAP
jgi:uncharacterized integral membrane protein